MIAGSLRAALAPAYLAACRVRASARLRGGEAPRSFARVAVVAALGRRNGIAEGARLQAAAWPGAALLDAGAALRRPFWHLPHAPATAYVFHCGAPQTASLLNAVLPEARAAWRIGYWAWELPDPPPAWRPFGALVQEIWTPSRFSAESLRRMFPQPVRVVPHVVPPRPPRLRDPAAPFTVLTLADSRSSLSRKNPAGAIAAFRRAFGDAPAARLIVKLPPGDPPAEVADALRGLPNARIVAGFLDEDALGRLFREADVLLSLHRAEGFGLPMLEAMAHGVPVVATGWSGNLDFMSDADSLLVPFRLVPVLDPAGIYRDSSWAEPDTEAAAAMLRALAEDADRHAALAAAAHARAVAQAAAGVQSDGAG